MTETLVKHSLQDNRRELIRSELNLERFPLFTTSQFKGKSREFVRRETLPNGDLREKKVVIGRIAGNEVGVFRILDLKCFYALIRLWERASRPFDREVRFSVHGLAQILGKSWSGRSYCQLRDSLERLRKVPIDWVRAFYDKEREETHEFLETFTILASLKLYERRGKERVMEAQSAFRFNENLMRNLLSNYSKPVWLDVILGLKKEVSILLYLHLDLVMAKHAGYARRLGRLIEEDLDLSGSYPYPSYRKRVIEPALRELRGVRLSTGTLTHAGLERTADGTDWKAVFRKATPEQALSSAEALEVQALVVDILEVTGDVHSAPFYRKLARRALADGGKLYDLIYRCLSEVKQDDREGRIRANAGAAFTDRLKRYATERGLDLGLKSS